MVLVDDCSKLFYNPYIIFCNIIKNDLEVFWIISQIMYINSSK